MRQAIWALIGVVLLVIGVACLTNSHTVKAAVPLMSVIIGFWFVMMTIDPTIYLLPEPFLRIAHTLFSSTKLGKRFVGDEIEVIYKEARSKLQYIKLLIGGILLMGAAIAYIPIKDHPERVIPAALLFIIYLIYGKKMDERKVAFWVGLALTAITVSFFIPDSAAEAVSDKAKGAMSAITSRSSRPAPHPTPLGLIHTVPLAVCGDANAPRYFVNRSTRKLEAFELEFHEKCASSVFLAPDGPAHVHFREVSGAEDAWTQIVTWDGKLGPVIPKNDPLWSGGSLIYQGIEHHGEEDGFRVVGRGTYVVEYVPLPGNLLYRGDPSLNR
ncbi:MAG: hypothetical protein Q7S28_01485 [bacterium]|nr:hypothetical protein [bacterium]